MASKESKEQGRSGRAGAEAPQSGSPSGQPRQGSDRVEKGGGGEEKHRFASGRAPSEQGENDRPGPEAIVRDQQGYGGAGRASGSHDAQGDRSQQTAHGGEPGGDHTRQGRQHTPGDRSSR